MDRSKGAENKTTPHSIYIRTDRFETLSKAATRVSYELDGPTQTSAAELARYLIDNFLEQAMRKMIADARK